MRYTSVLRTPARVGLCSIVCLAASAALAAWPPPSGLPMTRWAQEVSPDRQPLPEYPRPQLVREQWLNLNGMWDYAITAKGAAKPEHFDGKILVPFAPQSLLSQVNKPVSDHNQIWYRRALEIPPAAVGHRVVLNFGAVNWECHVFVNGKEAGSHTGGYDGFTCDITDALKPSGPQELALSAWNPIEGGQPRGKQALKPDGIFYTPTTGIWQTVWIESVPNSHIDALRIVPDVDAGQLHLTVAVANATSTQQVEAIASADGKEVGRAAGKPGELLAISIPNARLWSPASPFLYDLKVTLKEKATGEKSGDSVASYFGMRKISIGPDSKGLARIMLNNKPVFQNGFLDQGFWPEGIYTAPTDEALKFDLLKLREFNYNMDRKHVKVEPERWYYWADKLGVLVWQDMPAAIQLSYPRNSRSIPHREDNFESELRRMVRGRFNHPSIVMWILFNEGWGLPLRNRKSNHDKVEAAPEAKVRELRMVKAVREEDPTRLINAESGAGGGGNDHGEDLWDFGFGDVIDYHCYGHDGPKAEKQRAGVVGEYGWGLAPIAALRARLESSKHDDISGCVVTQLTDVENEHNGALSYDRKLVRNVQLDKEFPAGIIKVLHDFGYTDYPGGERHSP
jgi:beta-galactosidase/beta-glucuronidase